MTDQLLPPDPSRDGWYWICHTPNGKKGNGLPVPFVFFHEHRLWFNYDNERPRNASDMWAWGWRLASPHPIPGPEQLDALHALPAGIDRRNSRIQAVLANYQKATVDEPYARAKGRMSGFKMCAAMLRAALGAKPDDPPGESI